MKLSYNYHVDDCDETLNLGLTDMLYKLVLNDYDETTTYGKTMFHVRIINEFSMLTIDSTTADNHQGTLSTGTNDLKDDTGSYTNHYPGQVEDMFGLFSNSIDTGNIAVNKSGSDCDR